VSDDRRLANGRRVNVWACDGCDAWGLWDEAFAPPGPCAVCAGTFRHIACVASLTLIFGATVAGSLERDRGLT
jgi:hypothetical protein